MKKKTEILKNEHEWVLQGNAISRGLYSCTVLTRKIISYAAMKISTKQTSEIVTSDETFNKLNKVNEDLGLNKYSLNFKIADFLKDLKLSKSGTNYVLIKNAFDEVFKANIKISNGDKSFIGFNWFSKVYYNQETGVVSMTFTPEIGEAILNYSDGYSAMKLSTVGNFKSIYAFRYYEIAISMIGNKGRKGNSSGKWFFQYSIEELRALFQIPKESYSDKRCGTSNFINKVVREPLEELNNINNDFKIEFKKIIENRKTVGFRFECKETSKKIKIAKTDSPEVKQEKQEINEDWAKEPLWAKMQEMYPEVWTEYFEQEKHNGFFVFDEVAKNATYERMISEGYEFKESKKSKSKKRNIPAKTKPENLEEPSKNEMDNEIYKLQMAKRMPEWLVVSEDLESMSKVSGISLPSKNSLMYNVTVFEEMQKRGLI